MGKVRFKWYLISLGAENTHFHLDGRNYLHTFKYLGFQTHIIDRCPYNGRYIAQFWRDVLYLLIKILKYPIAGYFSTKFKNAGDSIEAKTHNREAPYQRFFFFEIHLELKNW